MQAVLIDDHELIRDSVGRILSEQLGFLAPLEAGDLESGLTVLSEAGEVDLIMVDLHMPGSSGPESLAALVEAFPEARIIVMSASESKEDVLGCISVGVDGYIPKSLSVAEMVAAIQQVLDGGMFVPRALTRRGIEPTARPRAKAPGLEHLTPRQTEVLDQLLLGLSSKEIARALDVAEGTVKIHLAAIYRALGVRTRAEAISRLMSPRL
ncbi:MAG TPA: response regulator transcription factor [Caulobacteraceae bacterium]|nr:response regulator transcription factor [Caulobacteraceae bacterium]